MRYLDETEIQNVSGGLLPDTGSEAAMYAGQAIIDFAAGFIHGFVGSF